MPARRLDVDVPTDELNAREPAPEAVKAFAAPTRGWEKLYVETVGQANTGADLDFLVLRYNPDGTVDAGYGTGGATVNNWGGNDRAAAVVAQDLCARHRP